MVRVASFPANALAGRRLSDVVFEGCYFQPTSLEHSSLIRCNFKQCEFERLELSERPEALDSVVFDNCACRSVVPLGLDTSLFAPLQVRKALENLGITVQQMSEANVDEELSELDDRLGLVQRVIRIFMRSTGVNENTLKQRLGAQASNFFSDVLPILEEKHIVVEVPFRGSGRQRRYQLGTSLDVINRAIEDCDGSLEQFLESAGAK
jgi:hypothetical protein